jgi:type III secretion system YscQ/HrcQ family protein
MYSPYPFERLPKLARTQIRALSQLHSLFSDTDLALAQRAAEVLLGLSLSCSVGVPSSCTGSDVAARTRAVWIELTLADLPGMAVEHSVWLELPFGLCEFLIDRTLGGEGALGMLSAGTPIDELGLGALAYLTARACAAAGSRFRLQMLQVGPPSLSDATLVKLAVRIASRGEAAVVQLYAPSLLLRDLRERPRRRVLAEITLTLWADAGAARLDLATLRTLHAGDVLVLQRTGLWRESANAEFQGAVDVRVLGSATALHCRLRERGLEVETIACSPDLGMTSGRRIPDSANESPSDREAVSETLEGARTVDLARDAPIEVALEIARFQLRLDELERVRPGDVLVAGRRIGEAVTLRAANQPIAEGELVDVEGELGVRITRILSE